MTAETESPLAALLRRYDEAKAAVDAYIAQHGDINSSALGSLKIDKIDRSMALPDSTDLARLVLALVDALRERPPDEHDGGCSGAWNGRCKCSQQDSEAALAHVAELEARLSI